MDFENATLVVQKNKIQREKQKLSRFCEDKKQETGA